MQFIPYSEPDLGPLEAEYLQAALASGWIGSKGDFIDLFEERFAKYIGVKYAVTCSSGTAALQLAYLACGMANKPVNVPDNTFIATKSMAQLLTPMVNEIPVDEHTWNLNLADHRNWHGFTVAVHLYGNPCDMGQVYRYKGVLIEDCAQSIGSEWRWKKCGSFGMASIFSFHSAKHLTTGEGGMVCTNDANVMEAVRLLKDQCMVRPYQHRGIGFNYRMTNLQAAIGVAQLERIHELVAAKRAITKFYDENLPKSFMRQKTTRWSNPCKWANTYRHTLAGGIRIRLREDNRIDTRPGFIGDDFISLPCSTKLTRAQLEQVVEACNQYA